MFFADHYEKSWFNTWDARWYMGFNVASYPPLAHQILALVGFATGLESAYVAINFGLIVLMPFAVFLFSKTLVSEDAAGYAALLSVLFPGILYSTYDWGQYTTLFGLVFGLFTCAAFFRYLKSGGALNFFTAVFLFEVTISAHHFSGLIFTPSLLMVTCVTQLLKKGNSSRAILKKSGLFLAVGLPLASFVLYPVLFGAVGTNTPIPHPSTLNYFSDLNLFTTFFIDIYGFFAILIPLTFIFVKRCREFLSLIVVSLIFLVLGLGGTTPLPQLLFGSSWVTLTYERFALFALLSFTPLFGLLFMNARRKKFGKHLLVAFLVPCLLFSFWASNASVIRPQPTHAPAADIANFLNSDQHSEWRYLTLGFDTSDFSKLSMLTNATTIDGWYYRGFNITELANTDVGYFSGAKYVKDGVSVLTNILENASDYNLRFVFCNDPFYEPILNQTGFQQLDFTFGQVTVWAKYDSEPLVVQNISQTKYEPTPIEYAWGILPLAWLLALLLVLLLKNRKSISYLLKSALRVNNPAEIT